MNNIKQIIKSIWKIFYNTFFKISKIENSIRQDLEEKYREYQLHQEEELLHRLIHLVDFCERVGINGKTCEIQKTIKTKWLEHIAIKRGK